MKLSIIIPVYNEEQTIGEIVERVRAVDLPGIEKEIIIANDGSSDGTREAMERSRWVSDPRITIHHLQINVGKLCNQTCRHCHVDAGPKRKEIMTRETVDRIVDWLAATDLATLENFAYGDTPTETAVRALVASLLASSRVAA